MKKTALSIRSIYRAKRVERERESLKRLMNVHKAGNTTIIIGMDRDSFMLIKISGLFYVNREIYEWMSKCSVD